MRGAKLWETVLKDEENVAVMSGLLKGVSAVTEAVFNLLLTLKKPLGMQAGAEKKFHSAEMESSLVKQREKSFDKAMEDVNKDLSAAVVECGD